MPSPELVREFVIAGHGDLEKVRRMLAEVPELLNRAHVWQEGDTETALQGAAHVGNAAIAEYLLGQGAPLDICTAAMLGRLEAVRAMLEADPSLARGHGAHRIPLLPHAAHSGNVELARLLYEAGATEGSSMALVHAVQRGHYRLAGWLLEFTRPDLNWKNFQGKTARDLALERGDGEMVALLEARG
ncbi:ankyrin repeat domain-containing protein [Calidithermus chliarophilus]|uniref:ankyrin repeat domain-containing protein n=1 Tax=Calidithermus chliarophilus TaxID=52023 RepID=UPI000487D18F|nr:ankyrin repeat domain-containing protein [Calidithermus chliarophilus]